MHKAQSTTEYELHMLKISNTETLPQTCSSVRRDHDAALSTFAQVRPRLYGVAYHMLGTAAEAEDIVQDVWILWQRTNVIVVENPLAFLTTTITRLCINRSQSARSRHETSIDTGLREPVDSSADPELWAEQTEKLKHAVRVLLERLSPAERAAYILREAFHYSYRQIAGTLSMREANVRQLSSRARKHIAGGRCIRVTSGEQRRLMNAFIAATRKGDMAALEDLLS